MSTMLNLPVPQQEEISSPGKQPLASEDDPAVWKYPVTTRTLHREDKRTLVVASRSEGVLRAPK